MHIFLVCIHLVTTTRLPLTSTQLLQIKSPPKTQVGMTTVLFHLICMPDSSYLLVTLPRVSEANFLVIRLGLHTEIVAAASDFTCVWELMFKMGRVVFGDHQSLSIGLRVSLRNPKKTRMFLLCDCCWNIATTWASRTSHSRHHSQCHEGWQVCRIWIDILGR